MSCDRGSVLDFSATGIRINFPRCPRFKAGQVVELTLNSDSGQLLCPAEVVWVKKTGWRSAQVGFRFSNEETASQLRLFQAAYDPLGDREWSNS
jgi:Tfp pilus assembly protein PilZ